MGGTGRWQMEALEYGRALTQLKNTKEENTREAFIISGGISLGNSDLYFFFAES